jgi:hypothetical protein
VTLVVTLVVQCGPELRCRVPKELRFPVVPMELLNSTSAVPA